jgi:hypothetical protein
MVPQAPRTTADKMRQAEGATSDTVPPPPPGCPRPTPAAEAADGMAGGSGARASGGEEAAALDRLALPTHLSRLITSASQRVAPTHTSPVVRASPSPSLSLSLSPHLHDAASGVTRDVLQGLSTGIFHLIVRKRRASIRVDTPSLQDKT